MSIDKRPERIKGDEYKKYHAMTNENKIADDEFNVEQLFGSKTRVRLLTLFLENPDRSFYVRELTRRIDAQLNSVRRELKNLVDIGIVLEVEGKILDKEKELPKEKAKKSVKKKYYKANTVFTFFNEMRSIMKKSAVLMNKTFVKELTQNGEINLLFLTGRFIDDVDVPSDMLVVGEIDAEQLQSAIENFERQIGREVNYTYMPKDEYIYRMDIKDRFLESLVETDKVVLINTMVDSV